MTRSGLAILLAIGCVAGTTGCKGGSDTKILQKAWTAVIDAFTAEAEAEAVANLRKAISRKGASFRGTIFDEDGHTIPHTEFSGDKAIRTVCLTFYDDGEEFTTTDWSPKDEANFYLLFRE